jgi:tRNA threonylcarbamoyladenosine modification (KEOPS) complex Cgi121 subunit
LIEKELIEPKSKPVLCLCSSTRTIKELIEASKSHGKGRNFILLMEHSEKLLKRILPAYLNAGIRVSDGMARSNTIQMEMLLLVCGTMRIDKALKECGAKDPRNFLVFATKDELLRSFIKKENISVIKKVEPVFDVKAAGDVAMTELFAEH